MNPLSDLFNGIYVINLASRADRRREMDDQLRRIGLGLGAAPVELFEAVRPDDAGDFPSIGSRGCFLSHLGVLKAAVASGRRSILILEDDLNFSGDFMRRMPAVAEHLARRDWAFFYGGHRVGAVLRADAAGLASVEPAEPVETAHFLGIRGPAVASLVSYLEAQLARPSGDPAGGPMHVDGSYSWFRRAHPEFTTLAAVPELGHQRASQSDIYAQRWYDRYAGIRDLVAGLRRLRNRGAVR